MAKVTKADFLADSQGRRFRDIANDTSINFDEWCEFFSQSARQQRMKDSEQDHKRPALAGVIRELETTPCFKGFFSQLSRKETGRHRQAIGVLVRIVMEKLGWQKADKKGSLGHFGAAKLKPGARRASRPRGGLSKWFNRAEQYEPLGGFPY